MSSLQTQVFEKAGLAVRQFEQRSSVPLDYTRESLSGIEELLGEASDFIDDMPDEQIDAIRELFGSYILRVGHSEFGGDFHWHSERAQPVLVVGEPDFHVALMTFDKVAGRLSGDEADNIPFFYDGFAARAAQGKRGDRVLYV